MIEFIEITAFAYLVFVSAIATLVGLVFCAVIATKALKAAEEE